MWFTTELNPVWTDGIRPALISLKFEPKRIDETHADDKIDDRILAEIRRAGLVVADFTGHRGGVYFEAGFALGLGIPVIWTCRRSDHDKTHFDTRQYQHLLWDTPEDLKEKLVNHIAARITGRILQ
jgi:nucleoside 2-deoxyribosyltransferase